MIKALLAITAFWAFISLAIWVFVNEMTLKDRISFIKALSYGGLTAIITGVFVAIFVILF